MHGKTYICRSFDGGMRAHPGIAYLGEHGEFDCKHLRRCFRETIGYRRGPRTCNFPRTGQQAKRWGSVHCGRRQLRGVRWYHGYQQLRGEI